MDYRSRALDDCSFSWAMLARSQQIPIFAPFSITVRRCTVSYIRPRPIGHVNRAEARLSPSAALCWRKPTSAFEMDRPGDLRCFPGSGARIRTRDLRVMSSNPIPYTVDRRATHLRVTFRSWVVQSPARAEMMYRGLYLEGSPCQTRTRKMLCGGRLCTKSVPRPGGCVRWSRFASAGRLHGHRSIRVSPLGRAFAGVASRSPQDP